MRTTPSPRITSALSQSQFPVFTIYAQKSCLAVKPCERAWCIDRVQGHRLQGHARRTMSASSRQHCLELCLGERDFLCRTVKPIDGFTLLLIETSDPSGSCVATSASIGGTFTAQAFRIKEWIEGGGLKRPEISRWSRTEGETRHVNCTISVENGEKVKRRKGTNDYKANELSGERNERRELLDGTGVCMKNRSILGGILTQRHRNELFEGKDKGENGHRQVAAPAAGVAPTLTSTAIATAGYRLYEVIAFNHPTYQLISDGPQTRTSQANAEERSARDTMSVKTAQFPNRSGITLKRILCNRGQRKTSFQPREAWGSVS
uniref:Apple domain-containing protein n=1 Tax=Vespula pensylvanica TaxID=30213 RepID=A0A834PDB0_VESPE|nr:hypothetical protein H0235_003610 [Vespula pensylvanica]